MLGEPVDRMSYNPDGQILSLESFFGLIKGHSAPYFLAIFAISLL